MKLLPVVAYSSFIKEFKLTENNPINHYYKEQCAMKWVFGIKATIKFI